MGEEYPGGQYPEQGQFIDLARTLYGVMGEYPYFKEIEEESNLERRDRIVLELARAKELLDAEELKSSATINVFDGHQDVDPPPSRPGTNYEAVQALSGALLEIPAPRQLLENESIFGYADRLASSHDWVHGDDPQRFQIQRDMAILGAKGNLAGLQLKLGPNLYGTFSLMRFESPVSYGRRAMLERAAISSVDLHVVPTPR